MQSNNINEKTNSINILAERRAPPLNIGYNVYGIEATRKVLYRNFH